MLGACGFEGNPLVTDAAVVGDTPPNTTVVVDSMQPAVCPWTAPPTNLTDPCLQPLNSLSNVNGSQDFGSTGEIIVLGTQQYRYVRLDALTVASGQKLTLTGGLPILLAVDGAVNIAGTVEVTSGANSTGCAALTGKSGGNYSGQSSSSGGGAGAAGQGDGGDGGDGSSAGAGKGGMHSAGMGSSQTPPRTGCKGGDGGTGLVLGIPSGGGGGGDGGGAVEIASATSLTVTGKIRAVGRGGHGAGAGRLGAGGGGSGGAIFLEAPVMSIAGTLCADGGAGGLGGGDALIGLDGGDGQCTGSQTAGATSAGITTGGKGGDGGARDHANGTNAANASGSGGGGGGGGGVGWIRVHQLTGTPNTTGATITPDAMLN